MKELNSAVTGAVTAVTPATTISTITIFSASLLLKRPRR